MKKLGDDRDNYFLWKSGQGKLEDYGRILVASEYHTMRKEQGEKQLDLTDTDRNKIEIEAELDILGEKQKVVQEKLDQAESEVKISQSKEGDHSNLIQSYQARKK